MYRIRKTLDEIHMTFEWTQKIKHLTKFVIKGQKHSTSREWRKNFLNLIKSSIKFLNLLSVYQKPGNLLIDAFSIQQDSIRRSQAAVKE